MKVLYVLRNTEISCVTSFAFYICNLIDIIHDNVC